MELRSKLVRLALAASTLFVSGATALAQSTCTQLETALVALERTGPGAAAANFQRLDAAYNQKRFELDQAVAQARAGACMGGFLSMFSRPDPNCPALMQRVGRLQAELTSIGAQRQQNAYDPGAVARERSRLLRALGNNNCGPQYAQFARGGFGEQQFLAPVQVGTFRTLCVRTCDGFYFPISFSTVRSAFQSDAQTCQQMCPAAQVELYVHSNPGQESEQAVSLSGQPYTSLPTAFRYRTEFDPSCTCRTTGQTASATNYFPSVDAALASLRGPRGELTDAAVRPTIVPVPISRPSLSEDPETLANLAGDFVPQPTAPLPAKDDAVADLGGAPAIRVVGPAYYYTLPPTVPEATSRTVAQ
ncbi:MAG: DUF2865 domain-containing protein [Bauldia sp.]|nr:DUF2865 domain-containing protein [Bauldia sp.]